MFLLAKIMGEKQISQLSLFDYMIGITVGSIAAELATDLENPVQPLTALVVYGVAEYLVSLLTNKSLFLRKLISGKSKVLMDHGKIYRGNLAAARLDVGDFITLCRTQGYFDLSQIETAILEHNGAISILPKALFRAQNPADTGLDPAPERPKINIIIDGKILPDKLKLVGRDERWLAGELKRLNLDSEKSIQLAFIDESGNLNAFPMVREKYNIDLFE